MSSSIFLARKSTSSLTTPRCYDAAMMTTPITGDTWGDEVDSVRAFLLAEAEKPFAELRPVVAASRERLLEALAGTSKDQVQFRPPDGEGEDAMGIAEVIRHVSSIEAIFAERIRQLGLGVDLNVTKTYPGYMEDVTSRDPAELAAEFEASGARMDAAIAEIDGRERLDTTDPHRLFGPLNCRGWYRLHGVHLEDHVHQIAKIKAMEGFPR
jgi:hypothetical protein